jgi:hypothetical protein
MSRIGVVTKAIFILAKRIKVGLDCLEACFIRLNHGRYQTFLICIWALSETKPQRATGGTICGSCEGR